MLSKHTRVQALSSNDRRIDDQGETGKPITCHTSEVDSDNAPLESAVPITVANQVPCPEDDQLSSSMVDLTKTLEPKNDVFEKKSLSALASSLDKFKRVHKVSVRNKY